MSKKPRIDITCKGDETVMYVRNFVFESVLIDPDLQELITLTSKKLASKYSILVIIIKGINHTELSVEVDAPNKKLIIEKQ